MGMKGSTKGGKGRMHWVCSTHLSLSSHIYVNVSVRRTSKATKLTVQFSEDRFGLSFNFNSAVSASFSSLSLRGMAGKCLIGKFMFPLFLFPGRL